MWVAIVVSLALGLGLARVMVGFQIQEISKNWDKYRCQPQVLVTGNLFKPAEDPRTASEFAFDNFNFCTSELAKAALTYTLKPVFDVFYKMVEAAIQSIGFTMNLRTLSSNLFHGLNNMFAIFTRRFNLTIHEFHKTFLLQMSAMQKSSAIATASIYAGISMVQSVMNFIQLMINICVAIVIILIVMVVFLFFLLAPTIPLILVTVGILTAAGAGAALGGAGDAFCFSPETLIPLVNGDVKQIRAIRVGDVLKDNSIVTATMQFATDGSEEFYNLDGIVVSGSHIVYTKAGRPVFVKDSGAILSTRTVPPIVHCLNTSNRRIPVQGATSVVSFADWEELDDDDMQEWDALVRTTLGSPVIKSRPGLCESETGFYPDTVVRIRRGGLDDFTEIRYVSIGDTILDISGWTEVVGIVKLDGSEAHVVGPLGSGANWVLEEGTWRRAAENPKWVAGPPVSQLVSLFTKSGTFMVGKTGVRDFSDIGLSKIENSYSFTLSRLLENACSR